MPSLPQLLNEAANQSASEIVIEIGKDPVLLTDDGVVPFASPLTESDVFDTLGQVLAPEQQAELAVGNVVEFNMDVDGGRWTLRTEPTATGLVLRGRAHGVAHRVEVGTPMDLPPLEPFQPEAPPPDAGRRTVRETAWDMGVPDLSDDHSAPKSKFPSRSSQPAWVSEESPSQPKGSEAGFDRGGIDLPPPEPEEEDGFEIRAPSVHAQERDTREQFSEGVPTSFPTPIPGLGGPAPEMGDSDRLEAPPPLPDASSISRSTTNVPLATVPSETEEHGDDDLAQFGPSVLPGSVCMVQGVGAARRFARYVNGGAFTVIEDADFKMTKAVVEDDPGSTYVVALEDPSACLGWMLRRLEEGARILVETRARTMEGARRTLLGVAASPRAETWLEVHSLHWLANQGGAWVMTSGSRR